jgi:phosphoglycolate phosphatase
MGCLGAERNLLIGGKMASTPFLIVFDCDGTLADSQHIITEAMRFAFESTGLAAPERSSILRIVGLSLDEAVAALAPDQREAIRDEIVSAFRERSAALRLTATMREPMFPGAAPLLRSLVEREDVILGLATGKSKRGVARIIEQHGLDGIFATVQTADDAPSKPHPGMLLQAMDDTGTSPATAVMIGDTSYDMLMAASANVASIGVTWGYHTKAELRQAGAKMIVHSFAELERALDAGAVFAPRYEAVA